MVWIFSIFFLRKSIAKWNVGSLTLGAPSMAETIDAACLASVDKATSPRKPFVTIPCVQEPNSLSQTKVHIVHYCAMSNLCSIVCIPEAFYSSGASGKDMTRPKKDRPCGSVASSKPLVMSRAVSPPTEGMVVMQQP